MVGPVPESSPNGTLSFDRFTSSEPATPAPDDLGLDDVAWMLYTSGTTGSPKGVLSTQRSCLWSVAACYAPVLGLSESDRVLWPLPLFHSLAHIVCVLGVTATGATARIMAGYSAEDVRDLLRAEDFTFLVGVPTMYHHLVDVARDEGLEAPGLRPAWSPAPWPHRPSASPSRTPSACRWWTATAPPRPAAPSP